MHPSCFSAVKVLSCVYTCTHVDEVNLFPAFTCVNWSKLVNWSVGQLINWSYDEVDVYDPMYGTGQAAAPVSAHRERNVGQDLPTVGFV